MFFMYMFFLLLGGGQYFYASTSPTQNLKSSFPKFSKEKQVNHIEDDQSTTLIEDTDVDVEEEFVANNKANPNTIFSKGKYSLLHTLYIVNSRQLILNYCCTKFKITPILGFSFSPIYITQRVIRI